MINSYYCFMVKSLSTPLPFPSKARLPVAFHREGLGESLFIYVNKYTTPTAITSTAPA